MTRQFEQYSAYTPMPTTTTASTMTDNRTTELTATDRLRAMLDERGVEYTVDDSVKGYLFIVNVKPKKRVFIETWENGGMAIWSGSLTPEQAIAATLDETYSREDMESVFVSGYSLGTLPVGSDPQWDENRQTVDEHMAELGWVRSATLGGEKPTTDVAEKIEELRLASLKFPPNIRRKVNIALNGIEQAIAATLGSGECEVVQGKKGPKCSKCGKELPEDPCSDYEGNFCPTCGARIRKAVV